MVLMFIIGFTAVTMLVATLMVILPEQPQYAMFAAGVGYITLVTTIITYVVKIILCI